MRTLRFIITLLPLTSCLPTRAQSDKTQGELRLDAAQAMLNQDLDALLSLSKSGKYSHPAIEKLEVRVLNEDSRLAVDAGLVIDMELRAIRDGKTDENMYTDFFPLKMALDHYDKMLKATMSDRLADGVPKTLVR